MWLSEPSRITYKTTLLRKPFLSFSMLFVFIKSSKISTKTTSAILKNNKLNPQIQEMKVV